MPGLVGNPHGRTAVIVSTIFTALATVTVLLRLFTRLVVIRCPGIDDLFITVSLLSSIGLTVVIGIQAAYGMGRHIYDIPPADVQISLKAFYASLIVYYLSLGLTKISILIQYQRIFSTRKFRLITWLLMALVVVYTIWTLTTSIFMCKPISAFWTLQGKCLNEFAIWFFNAGMNIFQDFVIIVLPIPVIRNLNLPRRQKRALVGIFAVGGFVCLVSILRLQSLVAISNSKDPTYDNPPAATWSQIETSVGIICSCLPCLRPLVTRYLPGVFSITASRTGGSGTGGRIKSIFGRSTQGSNNRSIWQPEGGAFVLNSIDTRDPSVNDANIRVVTEVDVKVESTSEPDLPKTRKGSLDG